MSNIDESLDNYLDEQITDRFTIDSLEKADWAVRKLSKHQRNIEQIKELSGKRIAAIVEWSAKEIAIEQSSVAYLESLLRPYAESQIKPTDKKRSLKVPSGSFGLKKRQPNFILDKEKLTAWAKQSAPAFIKTEESVKWAELKETLTVKGNVAITKDGEIVDGLTVEEQPYTLTVKGVD
jgi:hypothetical protein